MALLNYQRVSCHLLLVVDGCGWLWMVVDGCGWLWMVVDGCGWLWMVVDGCGWLWMVVDGCGWLWMVVDGCGYSSLAKNSGCSQVIATNSKNISLPIQGWGWIDNTQILKG